MEYEKLLDKAYEKLSTFKTNKERFEIPVAEIIFQGNQTIIRNFSQIAQKMRRDPKHLLKFLTKELASPGSSNDRAIFQTRLNAKTLQQKIESYAKEYVFCKECGRPDTKLVKEDRINFLICESCGSKYPTKPLK